MKYSIVIPTYNNKELLRNTLEALNYQRNFGKDDYEVIISDDGSSDNTFDYIKDVNRNYTLKYLYLERDADSCRARTRNHGWKNSSGEYIAFIDSDILVKPDYLLELERCFSMSSDILVLGNRLMLDRPVAFSDIRPGRVFENFKFDPKNFDILEYRYFLYESTSYNANAIMLPWTQVYSCNLALPKKWLELAGGFDENFKSWGVEDIELGFALFDKNIRIVVNSKLEVLHQYHGERNYLIIKKENITGYDRNLEYFLAKHPRSIKMRKKFAFQFLKGEISDDKMLMGQDIKQHELNIPHPERLDYIKKMILKNSFQKDFVLAINDYVEKTDLDIWLQLQENNACNVKYYPMSKRLDQGKMMKFLKAEKERQKENNNRIKTA